MKPVIIAILIFVAVVVSNAQSTPKTIKLDSLMNYMHLKYKFDGVVLAAEGKRVIYRKAFGLANREWEIPNTIDTKFRLGSVSKQFIGYVTINLSQQGKLSLNDPVSKYIPAFQIAEKKDITIRNLLTHTSGIFDYTDIPEFDSMARYSQDKLIGLIAARKLNFDPASKYAYSNSNFYLLTVVAEKTTGKKFEDVLDEMILKPLGMNNTGIEHNSVVYPKLSNAYVKSDKGYANAAYIEMDNVAAGMYSTVDDLFKWSLFIQSQLAENSFYSKGLAPYIFPNGTKGMYSSGWCLMPESILHQGHINGFANEILIDTANHNTVILLTNNDFKQLFVTGKLISSLLTDKTTVMLPRKVTQQQLSDYAGDFSRGNDVVSMKIENGDLNSYFNGHLISQKPFLTDEFYAEPFEGNIRFKRDEKGKVIAFESFEGYNWIEWKRVR